MPGDGAETPVGRHHTRSGGGDTRWGARHAWKEPRHPMGGRSTGGRVGDPRLGGRDARWKGPPYPLRRPRETPEGRRNTGGRGPQYRWKGRRSPGGGPRCPVRGAETPVGRHHTRGGAARCPLGPVVSLGQAPVHAEGARDTRGRENTRGRRLRGSDAPMPRATPHARTSEFPRKGNENDRCGFHHAAAGSNPQPTIIPSLLGI